MYEQAKKDYEEAQKHSQTLDNKPAVAYSRKGYKPRNPKEVTKQEFNHHYWAIANELLSKDELGMLNSTNFSEYEQNSDGFYMIPIGENGVLNKIVFTDGKQDYYSINHIIEIYANNETDLSDIRRIIYDGENNGIPTQDTELLQTYTSKTYSYNDFVREISQDKGNSSSKQDGRGSSRKTQFSLKDTVEQDVVKEYGNTYNWKETGYILTDGTQLDLSGKKQGARGGYRAVDHRDIFDIYEDGDTYGTEAMIEFMSKGAIRVMPESPGIDLMIEPNKEQYRKIGDLVERLGRQERSFYIDFSDENGDVVDSLSYEGMVSWRKVVADIKYYFAEGKLPKQSELSQFRFSRKITADMTDEQRVEILKEKSIVNIPIVNQNIVSKEITSWEDINNVFGKEKRTLIKKLASEFNVFKEYRNQDIELEYTFSKTNFDESYHKQIKNYQQFAKLFTVFDDAINNSIGIEVHNRNNQGYKEDITLKNAYVLLSAFEDGEEIVPVKFEVKEFKDKPNSLYVAITLNGIKKTEVLGQGNTEHGVTQYSRSVNISILDFMRLVNPSDTNFTKYFPESITTDEQKEKLRFSRKAQTSTEATQFLTEMPQEKITKMRKSNHKIFSLPTRFCGVNSVDINRFNLSITN